MRLKSCRFSSRFSLDHNRDQNVEICCHTRPSTVRRHTPHSILFGTYQQKSMNSTLDRAGSFQDVLRVKQAFPAAVYGEARKYPLDNVCEPDQRAYIKEPDGSEALLCVQI